MRATGWLLLLSTLLFVACSASHKTPPAATAPSSVSNSTELPSLHVQEPVGAAHDAVAHLVVSGEAGAGERQVEPRRCRHPVIVEPGLVERVRGVLR